MVVVVVTAIQSSVAVIALGIASVVALIAFLTARELASTTNSGTYMRLSKFSGVAILPLGVAFAVMTIIQIIEIL
ncbi:hypothetical protein ACFLTB_04230 [Chloroflexota bacterium]